MPGGIIKENRIIVSVGVSIEILRVPWIWYEGIGGDKSAQEGNKKTPRLDFPAGPFQDNGEG